MASIRRIREATDLIYTLQTYSQCKLLQQNSIPLMKEHILMTAKPFQLSISHE